MTTIKLENRTGGQIKTSSIQMTFNYHYFFMLQMIREKQNVRLAFSVFRLLLYPLPLIRVFNQIMPLPFCKISGVLTPANLSLILGTLW